MTDEIPADGGCHFCSGGHDVVQKHHIVPRRFDGSDDGENLVELCPTCHRKIESLYDKRFYDELGVEKSPTDEVYECNARSCTTETRRTVLVTTGGEIPVCEGHERCPHRCGEPVAYAIPIVGEDGLHIVCERHVTCDINGCQNTETEVHNDRVVLCEQHGREHSWGEYDDE